MNEYGTSAKRSPRLVLRRLLAVISICVWSLAVTATALADDQPDKSGSTVTAVRQDGLHFGSGSYFELAKCGGAKRSPIPPFSLGWGSGGNWIPKQELNKNFPKKIEIACSVSIGAAKIDKFKLTWTFGGAWTNPLPERDRASVLYISNTALDFYLLGRPLPTCNYGPTVVNPRTLDGPARGDVSFALEANDFTMGPAKDGSWCSWLGYNLLVNYLTGRPGDIKIRLAGDVWPNPFDG